MGGRLGGSFCQWVEFCLVNRAPFLGEFFCKGPGL